MVKVYEIIIIVLILFSRKKKKNLGEIQKLRVKFICLSS